MDEKVKSILRDQHTFHKPNKAVKDGKRRCIDREGICTIPKFGGMASLNDKKFSAYNALRLLNKRNNK